MNTTDLIALVRLQALIEPSNTDYTDAVIMRELNNALTTKFERLVVDAHAGYWLQSIVYTTTSGNGYLRLPPRAIGLSHVEIAAGATTASSGAFLRLAQISEGHTPLVARAYDSLGQPQFFVLRGDRIQLLPTPDNSSYLIKLRYYIRPSRLVTAQASGFGLVIAVTPAARTVTVSNLPAAYADDGTTSAGTVSAGLVDIVGAAGWRELQVVEATISNLSTTTYTLAAPADLSSVAIGDYVRRADQNEWPQLPEDYHRCLADIASVKILIQRDYQSKAGGYAQDVNADMKRFSDMISMRVQEETRTPRAALPSLRRRW